MSGGASLLGGALSSRGQARANEQNAALQREFAQYGIRWKVADAKAAGLHPLYAIGAVSPSAQASYSSTDMGRSVSQAGSRVADHVRYSREERSRKAENAKRRLLMQDQLLLEQMKARSQINVDTAQANYYNALAASARADANNQADGATSIEGIRSEDVPPPEGAYKPKAPEVTIASRKDKSTQAGPAAPAWMDVTVIDDERVPKPLRTLKVPRSDEGPFEEFLEKLPVIAAANALRYYKWLSQDDIRSMYMSPFGRARMLAMAIKAAPGTYRKILAALRRKYGPPRKIEHSDRSRWRSDR